MDRVAKLASQSAVVIFSESSCAMSHSIKRLMYERGVNPAVYELDEEPRGNEMKRALAQLLRPSPAVPAVFIGGQLVGGANNVMAMQLTGELLQLLMAAGAIWL